MFQTTNWHLQPADGILKPSLRKYSSLGATTLFMHKLLFLMFLILSTLSSKSQGGWNIGYIKIDSINKTHIGQKVKVDFKSVPKEIPNTLRSIRSYVGTKDTGSITIDSTLLILLERRVIYVDHGSYDDQFLECLNCKDSTFSVMEAVIMDINQYSIIFNFEIQSSKQNPRKSYKFFKEVRVSKASLDGLMYKL
jgi:hypothetical protein